MTLWRWLTIFGISIISIQTTQAFFMPPEDIHVDESLVINAENESLLIERSWEVTNTSHEKISRKFWYPITRGTTNYRLSVDFVVQSTPELKNEQKINQLLDWSEAEKNPKLLIWSQTKWEKILMQEIEIPPKSKLQIRLTQEYISDFVKDFWLTEIPLSPYDTKTFTMKGDFSTRSKSGLKSPEHLYHELPIEPVYQSNKTVLFFKGDPKQIFHESQKTFTVFWSAKPNPRLWFVHGNEKYIAHFSQKTPRIQPQKVIIIIDRSGSLVGDPWIHLQSVLPDVLEPFGENALVEVYFLEKKLTRWRSEVVLKNSVQTRRDILQEMTNQQPKGKADFDQLLTIPQQDSSQTTMLIFTDEGVVETDKFLNFPPTAVFSFSPKSNFRKLAQRTGGIFISLFSTTHQFVEGNRWIQGYHQWIAEQSLEKEKPLFQIEKNEKEILPQVIPTHIWKFSRFFIGREIFNKKEDILYKGFSPFARFIPRVWAKYQLKNLITKIWEKSGNSKETQNETQAILSIMRYFGVNINEDITSASSFKSLQKKFSQNFRHKSLSELQVYIDAIDNSLNSPDRNDERQFYGSTPMYRIGKKSWESENYYHHPSRARKIHVAPWSEAYRQMLRDFPDIFASGFAIDESVAFCSKYVCLQVSPQGEKKFRPSQRLYVLGHHLNHWGNKFFEKIADNGWIEVPQSGDMRPDEPMIRGDFATIIFRVFFANDTSIADETFSDVSSSAYFYQPIQTLASKGIIKGYQSERFYPLQPITRAESVKVLLAANNFSPKVEYSKSKYFDDVSGWPSAWVDRAFEQKIIQGVGEKIFAPNSFLTRAQAAKMLLGRW